jgi:hypothetical protein
MKTIHLLLAAQLAVAGAAWSQTEIERDLDGNASVFQTAPSQPKSKTGGADVRN